MNGLPAIEASLVDADKTNHEIFVGEELRIKALIPLTRMLDFAKELNMKVKGNA